MAIAGWIGLELTDLGSADSGPSLEAFWHEDGSGFDFVMHREGTLPFAVVERFVAAARKNLPLGEESADGLTRPQNVANRPD